MWISEYVKKARTGDEKAFNWLVKHFEPYFCDNVVKFNNDDETLRADAKRKLPDIIRKHINNNYDSKLDNYLRARAHIEFRDKNKLSDTRVLERETLISTYSKRFLKHIIKYKYILTEEELEQFSINYITELVDKFINDRNSFSNNINTRIAIESKYIQDEDIFLSRYVVREGLNDKIVNYFSNKYKYLLEDYKTKNSYFILSSCYKYIFSEILGSIISHKSNMESYLCEQIHKKHVEIERNLKDMEKEARTEESSRILLYYSYSSLKVFVFEKYKDIVNMPSLKLEKIINQKYDLYFSGYMKGTSKSDLRRYMINSFNNYFNWVLNNSNKKDITFIDENAVKIKDGEDNANKTIS